MIIEMEIDKNMTKEKALYNLYSQRANYLNLDDLYTKDQYDALTIAIQAIEGQKIGEWISVKERLPKDSEFVLLTIRRMNEAYNHQPFISVGYIDWNQTVWWCAHDGDCEQHQIDVLAWMPLPEPYQEQEKTPV